MNDTTGLNGSIAAQQNKIISASDQNAEEIEEAQKQTLNSSVENKLDLVIQWIIYNHLTVRVVLHIKRVAFMLLSI